MYSGVPMMVPSEVCPGECAPSSSLAMPKSSTFTKWGVRSCRTRKMFSGLRSRCTTPLRWAAWSASHTWVRIGTITEGGCGLPVSEDRGLPSRYSITR